MLPANTTDAHRPLRTDHQLPSVLSHVESRTVGIDYTFRYAGKLTRSRRMTFGQVCAEVSSAWRNVGMARPRQSPKTGQ